MARFDVHRHERGSGYLLDCQADVLAMLSTRFVVPLLSAKDGPTAISRLNPAFRIAGEEMVMYTQFAGTIPARELGPPVGSLAEQDSSIMNALDMLLTGY